MKRYMSPQQIFQHIVLAQLLKLLEKEGKADTLLTNADFLAQMHRIDSINSETIDNIFDYFNENYNDGVYKATMEIIYGEATTDIPCKGNREYETESVAAMSPYGKWIGWTVFSGGGKHGDPVSVTMDNLECYHLDCQYEIQTVQILKFQLPEEDKKEENNGH